MVRKVNTRMVEGNASASADGLLSKEHYAILATLPAGFDFADVGRVLNRARRLPSIEVTTTGFSFFSTNASPCIDYGDPVRMDLSISTFSKTLGGWVVGTGNGGKLTAGAIAANTAYEVWGLWDDAGTVIDVGYLAVTDAIASNLPSGYTRYSFLGMFFTDNSGVPREGQSSSYQGNYFWLDEDYTLSVVNPGTTLQTVSANLPPDVLVHMSAEIEDGSPAAATIMRVSHGDFPTTPAAPSVSNAQVIHPGAGGDEIANMAYVVSGASGDFRYQLSNSDVGVTARFRIRGFEFETPEIP